MKTGRSITVEEAGTEGPLTLDTAFVASLPDLAALLAVRVRVGLDNGDYVAQNGVVELAKETRADAA